MKNLSGSASEAREEIRQTLFCLVPTSKYRAQALGTGLLTTRLPSSLSSWALGFGVSSFPTCQLSHLMKARLFLFSKGPERKSSDS